MEFINQTPPPTVDKIINDIRSKLAKKFPVSIVLATDGITILKIIIQENWNEGNTSPDANNPGKFIQNYIANSLTLSEIQTLQNYIQNNHPGIVLTSS